MHTFMYLGQMNLFLVVNKNMTVYYKMLKLQPGVLI